MALPRGGVVVGKIVAAKLSLPLDIIVTRKIGAPMSSEYAVAAVSSKEIVLNEKEETDQDYLASAVKKERQEIQRRLQAYRGKKPLPDLRGKTVILVDDGLATGLTMAVAIKEVRSSQPQKIILAAPVAPPQAVEKLKNLVDQTVILKIEPMFFAVGQFYKEFAQTTDEEVKNLLMN